MPGKKKKNDLNFVPTAKNKLFDVDVRELALTKSPAVPSAVFAVLKSNDFIPEGFEMVIKGIQFTTINKALKQTYGYVLIPNLPDFQGDVMSDTEVVKACHSYMKNLAKNLQQGQGTSEEHSYFDGVGYVIESVIDTDGSIAKAHGAEEHPGGWWIGLQVENDEIWKSIEEGEITGYSIGGSGKRSPYDGKMVDNPFVETVKSKLTTLIQSIKKEGVSFVEAFQEKQIRENLWDMFSSLETSITSIVEDDGITDKAAAVSLTIDQFKEVMIGYVSVAKAGAEISRANWDIIEDMDKAIKTLTAQMNKIKAKAGKKENTSKSMEDVEMEELKKLQETLEGINKRLDKLEKADDSPDGNSTKLPEADNTDGDDGDSGNATKTQKSTDTDGGTNDDTEKETKELLKSLMESMDGISGRLDKLEKSVGPRKGNDNDGDDGGEVKKSKFAGTAFSFTGGE